MDPRPPLGTLVIENVESLGPNAVIGIDTQFFTVQHFLKGIKLIPGGHHLLHFSESADDGVSMRHAWWFYCEDGEVLTVKWVDEVATFATHDRSKTDLGDIYQYMVSYPENPERWRKLSEFIDSEALEEYLPRREQSITTATPSAEENMVLLEILKSKKRDISLSDQSAEELRYTIIEPQKRRADAVAEQLTSDYLDRSWYLAELFGHDIELFLAEVQISFVHFVVLCNLCSCTQWMNLLGLASSSGEFLRSNHTFSSRLIHILKVQLQTLPAEYVLKTSGVQVVETEILQKVLSQFNETFEEAEQWQSILEIAHKKFGLAPPTRRSLDDDYFEVYDLSGHDENDEDAPAVVF